MAARWSIGVTAQAFEQFVRLEWEHLQRSSSRWTPWGTSVCLYSSEGSHPTVFQRRTVVAVLEPGDEKGDPVVGQGRGFRRNTSRARGIRVGVFSSSKRLSSRSRLLATGCRSVVTDSPGAQLGALN
jgi:hypothetical protein